MGANYCGCGKTLGGLHITKCSIYQTEILKVSTNISNYIPEFYKKTYSVTDCVKYVKTEENTWLGPAALRKLIDEFLSNVNLKESLNGENLNRIRQEKIKQTMINRHGVINAGQLKNNGLRERNALPKNEFPLFDDIKKYKKQVEQQSHKLLIHLKKQKRVPLTCYYTGLEFADNRGPVNPNDPYKRTIDHKVSVLHAYFMGWSVAECASENNIVFCTRLINTIKGNLDSETFSNTILPSLLKQLNYED